jgi:flagellar motor protein MotB
MIMKLVTVALVSTWVYSGNVPCSDAVSQLSDGRVSFGTQLKGSREDSATTFAAVHAPTNGLRTKPYDQVEPRLYKVRDDYPASNRDAGVVQVSKAGGEKEPPNQLEQQLLAKEKEIAILRGKTAAATDLFNFEKHRVGTLETRVTQQEQELRALRSRGQAHDQSSQELVFARSNLDQARQKIVDLERQLATSNLDHAKRRIVELDRQLDAKDKEIMAMRTDSDSKEKLKGDLTLRTEELKLVNQHSLAQEYELIRAKESLDKVNRRVTDLETQLTTQNAELEQAKLLLASLHQKSDAKKVEVPQKPAEADKKRPLPASIESGQPAKNTEQPSFVQSDEPEASGSDRARLRKDLANELRPELGSGSVSLWQVGNKLSLELATDELFAPGQAVVTRRGSSLLRRIGAVLQKFRYQTVEVAGHTDNTPIQNSAGKAVQDNSKLSRARAQQASRALVRGGLQADRVISIRYAATKPIVTDDSEESRSRNRPVEIIITQWSEPDDNSGDMTPRISKKQRMFSTQKVAHH